MVIVLGYGPGAMASREGSLLPGFMLIRVVQVVLDCLEVTGEASVIKQSARRQIMPERTEESDMITETAFRQTNE